MKFRSINGAFGLILTCLAATAQAADRVCEIAMESAETKWIMAVSDDARELLLPFAAEWAAASHIVAQQKAVMESASVSHRDWLRRLAQELREQPDAAKLSELLDNFSQSDGFKQFCAEDELADLLKRVHDNLKANSAGAAYLPFDDTLGLWLLTTAIANAQGWRPTDGVRPLFCLYPIWCPR